MGLGQNLTTRGKQWIQKNVGLDEDVAQKRAKRR
jgi:hypothetical protein